MAFDQNSVPKDLRPINIARTVPDEPRVSPVATSGGASTVAPGSGMVAVGGARSPDFYGVPDGSVPVFYPAGVSDAGFVGLGYGAPPPAGMGQWATIRPVSVGNVSVGVSNPSGGLGYNPSLGNRVVANAVDFAGNDTAGGLGCWPNMGHQVDGSRNREMVGLAVGSNLSARNQGSGSGADHLGEEGVDDSVSGKKVKFLCSFGGRILPRPSDGMLRYVGGQTRIISVRKDVTYNELVHKMVDTCGQPVVIKYQLPDEDLDALVSVSCPDDLDNMMEEYEKLVERSTDGSSKLRVFLFSSAELDAYGMGQFVDLNDGGQRYVDAVNGVMDGGNGYNAQKESIASATSTQNSDLGATEAVDSGMHAHGGASGPSSSGMLSPKGNSATFQDAAQKIVLLDPDATAFSDASLVSNPIVNPGPPQTLSSLQQVERSMPPPLQQQQLGYDLYQTPGIGMLQPTLPLHGYVDPHQEIVNSTGYVARPSQMGFSNVQISGPLYSPHHVQDSNRIGATQFIPAVHMTMMPSTSPVAMSPNMVQQLVQPQGARLERYPDENMSGPRLVQIPIDPSYNGYRPHLSHTVGGGVHGWQNVPQPEQVVLSDGSVPQQQVVFPRVNQRSEYCYMCQKALPHAHSDSLVQDQRDGKVSPLSELTSIHQSIHLEEAAKARATNQVAMTGPLAEDMVEQGAGAWPRVPSHVNHHIVRPLADPFLYPQNVEVPNENDRNAVGRADNSDQLKASVPYSFMELQGDVKAPYGLLSGAVPQSRLENSTLQHALPTQHHIRQEVLPNKPTDMPHFTGLPIRGSDYPVQESVRESSGELTRVGSGENVAECNTSNDHSRPVNEMMKNLRISHPEVSANVEQNRLDNKIQQMVRSEILMDDSFSQSQIFLDPNNSYIRSYTGVHQLVTEEVNQRDREVSGLEPAYINPSAVATGASRLQQNACLGANVEAISLNDVATSCRMGDFQDSSDSLFSNQDPWNLRHDNNILPPRPNKLIMRKDAVGAKDPFAENLGNSGGLVKDVLLDGFPQPLNNADGNFSTEQIHSSTAEELIKQELQAVAEGVASSVLQSGTTVSDSSIGKRNGPAYISNQDNEISNEDIDIEHKTKFEGIMSKAPEKAKIGFPVSDGIGRLQIIKNCDLEELRELGSGTFGTVYHGKWRGTDVAIKRINSRCFAGKPSEHERLVDDFWNEAINLADLHHPNVVAFYGVVLDGPGGTVATVTEYMVNGSLRNALQKNERSLDKHKRLLIAMDVAFGMEYLHGRNIVHFDLKSDNLLVNLRDPHRPICKVGDLGLSKVKCQTLISGGVRGTLPWMAPELLNGGSSLVSEKVDVFSFGIVLWELLTGEEPYADLHYGAIIGGIVSNTLRPEVPESCDHEWKSLMERCWSPEPKERPSFTEIATDLRAMASKIPPKGQNTQQQTASLQPPLVQK